MKQDKQQVGRPSVKDADRKQSYTVSCTKGLRTKLIKKYGSLSKALEALTV